MTRTGRRLGDEEGSTVIELVIVFGLLMIVTTALLTFFDSGVRAERGTDARSQALEDLRFSMARMSKDIRQAVSLAPTSNGTTLDMKTFVNGVQHRIVYDLQDGVLRRTVGAGSPLPLGRGVLNAQVFCYDPPSCTSGPQPGIEMVRLRLLVQPAISASSPIDMATDVQLRNEPAIA